MSEPNFLKFLSKRVAEREAGRSVLARLAREVFPDARRADQFIQTVERWADEYKPQRMRGLFENPGSSGALTGVPAVLLDAEAALKRAREAKVQVRDLLSGRAEEKLRRARGGQPWEAVTFESLKGWERDDVRKRVRGRGAGARRQEVARARTRVVEMVAMLVKDLRKERGEKAWPGYRRDPDCGAVSGVDVNLVEAAATYILGPEAAPSAQTIAKRLAKLRRDKRYSDTFAGTPTYGSCRTVESVLEDLGPDARQFSQEVVWPLLAKLGPPSPWVVGRAD